MLIQGDGKLGAFRITKDGYWEPTASYEFWYLGESVQIVQPVPLKSASVQLDESTNTLKIKVGPLEAEWSSGNHIFPTAGAKISATPWNDVADVDLSSAELKWIGRSR